MKSTIKPSQYRGVYKCGRKWKSQIQINGKQEYLGIFLNEEEAAIAYDIRALECGRVDCLNYSKRGGYGNPSRIYNIIKKKIIFGKLLHQLEMKKKIFFESLGHIICHPHSFISEVDLTQTQSQSQSQSLLESTSELEACLSIFSELFKQEEEKNIRMKELITLISFSYSKLPHF